MRRILPFLFTLLTLFMLPGHLAAAGMASSPLRFAPLPGEGREVAMDAYFPMLHELAQRLNRRVEFIFTASFEELFQRFAAGEIDLAYLGPLSYITLRDRYALAEPLVQFRDATGKGRSSCAIVAFGAEPLPLNDMHGHHFALPQTFATCGYMAVEHLLQQHGSGLKRNSFHYFANEEEALLAVVRGEFDVGGVRTATARQFSHLGIRIVAETEPLPGTTLVANSKTLTAKDRDSMRRFLTTPGPEEQDRNRLALWGKTVGYGAMTVNDADYGAARRFRGNLVIPGREER